MRKRIFTSTIAALALFAVVGLVSALAPSFASLNLARAHSPGGASLTALTLTVTSDGTALPLTPTFSSTVYSYTVRVENSVAEVTVAGTPDDDGTATADQQVNLPASAETSVDVVVTHTDSGTTTTTQTYTVTIFRESVDRAALMSLYRSTGTTRWWNRYNWGSVAPINTWYGVTTNSDGRVTELNLGANNLVGTLPAALGDLDQMVNLQLSSNRLRGAIPASLGGLTNLQELSFSNNQMSGSIPDLGGLTNLQELSFSNNQMSGSIPDLSGLTNLQKLYLPGNQLSGPIPDLSSLTSLTHLYLNYNQLSGALPNSLGDLTSLQKLVLSSNQLSGTIPTLNSLTNLVELSLDFNQLDGTIPTSLNSLTSLKELRLNNNQLSGTIPTLSSLTSLQLLWLHNNNLTETIPGSLNDLTGLKSLNLSHNQLSGEIPDLSGLVKLDLLSLRNNQLTGPIPAWLEQLTGLGILYLSVNQLSGDFPQALGNLTNLYFVRFASNPSLTGCVPLELRYLVTDERDHDFSALNLPFCMLSTLAFSDVSLTPPFASATTVYTASVVNTVESTMVTPTLADSSDRFSIKKKNRRGTYASGDPVPLAVGSNVITIKVNPKDSTPKPTYTVTIFREGVDRATLTALYNSAGGASWTKNDNWGSPTEPLSTWSGVKVDGNGNVTELALPDNNLSGPLPAELGSLTSLTTLDLSDNQLSGTIPDLSTLTILTTLNFGDNQLSGTIPDLSALDSLTTLNLGGNRLTGPIPEELGDFTQLELLYLDNNQLSGPIPAALGDLNQLDVARFAGNALTGCVPNGLRYLVTVSDFDSLPAHDFITVDVNGNGDTADDGDTPGLGLPFCTLELLTLSDMTLDPAFASDVVVYAASAAHDVTSTRVRATRHNNSDIVSITKDTDTYTNSDPVPLDVGSNVITIEVTPADGTPTHTYTVTVTRAPNTPPTFDEGAAATRGVDENTPADTNIGELIAATDDDNDTLTYSLDDTSAESFDIVEFLGQLRTKAALDFEDKSSYTVTVSVRDSLDANGDADEMTDDTIRVTVQVTNLNEAPVFTPIEPDLHDVDENTPAGRNIGAPVAATDDDNHTLTYSLDATDAASFNIDASSGQLRTKAALDYETGPNSYIVDVTAADPSGLNDTIEVTITVNNVEEEGTVTLSSTQPIEGTLLTATLDDPDVVNLGSVTWSWRRSQSRNATGTLISGATAATYTPVAADVGRFLRATASYTDGEASGKSAQAVSTNRVQAAPVAPNEPPVFVESPSTSRNVAENTSAGTNIGAPVAATDNDNDTLTYSLDLTSRATFDIVATTGQLRTSAALNFEGKSSYTVTVTATDPSDADDTITVTITVGNVKEAGTVTLSSTQPIEGTPLTATLDDPDDVRGSATWLWAGSPNGSSSWIPITGETSATYTPVAADVGDYLRATASYTDGEGPGKSAQAVSTNRVLPVPVAPNTQPIFDEGPSTSRNVDENTSPGEDIGEPVAATDPEDDTLTYSLDVPSRATFDMVATTGRLQTKAALDYETGTRTYIVTVDATDPAGLYDTIEVTITVNNVDEPGTVTLSSLQPQVAIPLTATLDDPDEVSGIVTWSWESSQNGTSSWTLISGETSATYSPDAVAEGRFLRATASYTDGEGSGKSAEGVSANVVQAAPAPANEPPEFPSNTTSRNVDENTARGVNIGERVAATDPNNDTLTYSLDLPSRASFNMVATTGRLQTKAALDYETGTHTYTVTVTATDPAGETDTVTVTITVNNVDEPGTVTLSSLQPQVGFQLTATLDDPDNVSGSVTWSWRSSPNRNSPGTLINGETSATYTPVAADVGDYLRATASYDDGEEPGKSAQAVSTNRVEAAPVAQNDPPIFDESPSTSRNVGENTSPGEDIGEPVAATDPEDDTLTYSLDADGAESFDINKDTGQLQTKADLDFETTATYSVTVTATDTAGGTDTITVSITVNNLDEPGTVTLSSLQPQVIFQLTATLDDLDDVRGSVTWSWARSPNRNSSGTLISGATSATYTPVAADVNHYLRATASYDDGEGSGKSTEGVSANVVQAAPVTPNEPPIFVESPPATRNVDENTPAGEDIGEPVAATDPDNDTLTYSLDAPSRASFDIVDTTGQLRTKADLDHEATATYFVTVTAADPAGATDTITVTIDVNNLDEPGTVTLSSLQPLVAIPLTATLDELDAVSSSSVTWSWARSQNGASDWTSISGETSATYTPVLDDVGDYLRATASYTDGAGSGKSAQAISDTAVEVAPGRNAPVFKEYPTATRSVARNTPAGRNVGAPFTATDADNDALTYSLGGRDRDSFDLDTSSGQLSTEVLADLVFYDKYEVFVSVSDSKDDSGNPETDPLIDTSTRVTINVTTTTVTVTTPSSGSSGGGSRRPAPTPTPTPSPTPTAIPTPTGPQFSGQIAAEPSVTATVVPEGTTLGLNGGGDLPGGVYVNFPPTAVALPVHVSVSVSNEAPDDVTAPSGTTLLPLTINITPETPLTLGTPLTIEINPTPEQLAAAGGDLNNLAVGVVTPHGVVVLPTQIMHGRLVVTIDHLSTFVLLAITDPGPMLTQPPPGDASSMGPLLQWTQPPSTTWFQVQVIPFNEDGPGINLVIGDGALVQAAQYQVLGPNFGSADPNYVMLPDLTYLWRVRTSTVLTNPTEADWSAWAVSSFKTPPASSSTITRVAPPFFGEVRTLTPTLTWANSNTAVFYYEVQLSKDYEFGPNAFLYSEYVHGGASTPPNSYVIPEAFPLEAGEFYYWRVRPRIQGDGDPLPWSRINVFQTPSG